MRYVVAVPVVVLVVLFAVGRLRAVRLGRGDLGCCTVADPARDLRMRDAAAPEVPAPGGGRSMER